MTRLEAPGWPSTADPSALLPAIVQDADTGAVRMLAWVNADAYRRMVMTGRATFFSRSRYLVWEKGETSGNTLLVTSLAWDCDRDALLVKARAVGPTCHTGDETCWGSLYDPTWIGTLARLTATIEARDRERPEGSYTARLLSDGVSQCAAKVVEEAGEAAVAALTEGADRFAEEAADLWYHLLVLARAVGVEPTEIAHRLAVRGNPQDWRLDGDRS